MSGDFEDFEDFEGVANKKDAEAESDAIAKRIVSGKVDELLGHASPKSKARTGESYYGSGYGTGYGSGRGAGYSSYGVGYDDRFDDEVEFGYGRRTASLSDRLPRTASAAPSVSISPRVMSIARSDAKAAGLRMRFAPSVDGRRREVLQSDFDRIVTQVIGTAMDIAESAGLIYKEEAAAIEFRKLVGAFLASNTLFWDGGVRYYSVDIVVDDEDEGIAF